MFTPWFPHWNERTHLAARYNFLNGAELVRARPARGEFARTEVPTAKIEITDEDFDDDCFQLGVFTFVSEKLRRAMALGPFDIQYFDVDSSLSRPLPRSKHYLLLHVAVSEDRPIRIIRIIRCGIAPVIANCLAVRTRSRFVGAPSRPMNSSTTGSSRSRFAPTNLRCAFLRPAARACVFWIPHETVFARGWFGKFLEQARRGTLWALGIRSCSPASCPGAERWTGEARPILSA